jgi:hypothetical protein
VCISSFLLSLKSSLVLVFSLFLSLEELGFIVAYWSYRVRDYPSEIGD